MHAELKSCTVFTRMHQIKQSRINSVEIYKTIYARVFAFVLTHFYLPINQKVIYILIKTYYKNKSIICTHWKEFTSNILLQKKFGTNTKLQNIWKNSNPGLMLHLLTLSWQHLLLESISCSFTFKTNFETFANKAI